MQEESEGEDYEGAGDDSDEDLDEEEDDGEEVEEEGIDILSISKHIPSHQHFSLFYRIASAREKAKNGGLIR